MKKYRFIILLIITLFMFSCKKGNNKTVLASVYGKNLYLEDIKDIIPENSSTEDSLMILRSKVDLWVRKQTLLNRAEINLSEQQKDIDYIVKEYKESLLIEKYKQEYIRQNLDTVITKAEAEKYYNEYPESFILNNDIIKAYFFKFSPGKKANEFKSYFLSDKNDSDSLIINFAENYADDYIDFTNKWYDLSVISDLLPISLDNTEAVVNQSKKIQTRDESYLYFVLIKDYKLKGAKMPYDYAEKRIKTILLNKRKINLINNLENKIYQNAVKNGRIKINIK